MLFNVATADDVRGKNCKVRQANIMNKRKAVVMVFRVGRRTAVKEFIVYEGFRLEVASAMKCLCITIQATGHIYSKTCSRLGHAGLKKPNALPLNAAMELSRPKIMLI